VVHPQLTLAPNFEAHNTLLDLFVQGGLIAVSALVWLVATTAFMTYRAKLDAMTTLLFGIAIYSIFHFTARHPIVWFAIVLCLVTASDSRHGSLARSRG
jgi:O-antigen ligase